MGTDRAGYCVCPNRGGKAAYAVGAPYIEMKCPKHGAAGGS